MLYTVLNFHQMFSEYKLRIIVTTSLPLEQGSAWYVSSKECYLLLYYFWASITQKSPPGTYEYYVSLAILGLDTGSLLHEFYEVECNNKINSVWCVSRLSTFQIYRFFQNCDTLNKKIKPVKQP